MRLPDAGIGCRTQSARTRHSSIAAADHGDERLPLRVDASDRGPSSDRQAHPQAKRSATILVVRPWASPFGRYGDEFVNVTGAITARSPTLGRETRSCATRGNPGESEHVRPSVQFWRWAQLLDENAGSRLSVDLAGGGDSTGQEVRCIISRAARSRRSWRICLRERLRLQ